jgi:hypothetical protein
MVFLTRNEIGKRNNVKNIELKRNLAVFSYVKREFRFALFCFEAKITKVERSEKFEAKQYK